MGRPKKYTKKSLSERVEAYFLSISRIVPVKEEVWTGELDDKGHRVYKQVPVVNQLGEEMTVLEYMVPPTVGGLCEFLGIRRNTWAEYCNAEKNPGFSDTTTRARGRMRAYLEQQLLTRKDVKGVIFDLQANYGYTAKQEIELGPRSTAAMAASSVPVSQRAALLREIAEEFSKDDERGPRESASQLSWGEEQQRNE